MKKLWNVPGDFMPDMEYFSRLRKRWQCWQVRMFVAYARPDICVKHVTQKTDRASLGAPAIWVCDQCSEEESLRIRKERETHSVQTLAAEIQHRLNTEEILEALRHCKECK